MDMDDYIGNINYKYLILEYKWVSDSQSPHMAMSFSCGEIVTHISPQEIRNPNFKNVRNSIFDTLTYFRVFFLLLCWRNAQNYASMDDPIPNPC